MELKKKKERPKRVNKFSMFADVPRKPSLTYEVVSRRRLAVNKLMSVLKSLSPS